MAQVGSRRPPARCKSMGRTPLPRWLGQAAIPWRTWAIPSSPWPCMASAHLRKIVPWTAHCVKPCSVESATAPLRAHVRPARPGKTARRRPRNTAQTPDYRDATARAPTSGPRGRGPGLAPGTPVTRGSQRHRCGRPHRDLGPCGTPAHGAGLARSVRCLPPGAWRAAGNAPSQNDVNPRA